MSFNNISLLFTAGASLTLATFVYLHGRNKLPNIFLALLALSIGAWCFGEFMGEMVAGKEIILFWTRENLGAAVLIPVFYLNFILAFTGQAKVKRLLLAAAYLSAAALILSDFTPWFVADIAPRAGFRFYPVPGPIYPFFAVYLLFFFVAAFRALFQFLRESEGSVKNQARYIFSASLVGFLGGTTAFFPVFGLKLPVVSHLVLPLYLAILAYAIVRHELLEIKLVFREGLIYSILTLCFAAFYALTILIAGLLFQNFTGSDDFTATLIVVFASVLVFQPLRDRIQTWVDRLFFRGNFYYEKTIHDLSDENLKLYRSLLQADKLSALGTVAAGMAHEIKNPLASIKGLTQVLPENMEDPEFIKKYSEIVPRQLDRINRIVEDLLDFGRPAKMAMGKVDVVNELESVLRLVENQCRKAEIEIVREFQTIPPITGDAEKLSQAFMNIILNAIQAMPNGGAVKIKIQKSKSKDNELIIEIADSGKGIPADQLPNIFDPFYTTKESGTGMGLAVTYRIIKEHGGEIEVESETSQGTKFKICLLIKPEPSV